MSDLVKEASSLFQGRFYKEVYNFALESISKKDISKKELEFFCDLVIECGKIKKIKPLSFKDLITIANSCFEKSLYKKSLHFYEKTLDFSSKQKSYKRLVEIAFILGEVQKAYIYSQKYLTYLKERKNSTEGINFITNELSKNFNRKDFIEYEIYFLTELGRYDELEKIVDLEMTFFRFKDMEWVSHFNLGLYYLIGMPIKGMRSRKEFVKGLFDFFICHGKRLFEKDGLFVTFKGERINLLEKLYEKMFLYSLDYKARPLGEALLKNLIDTNTNLALNAILKKLTRIKYRASNGKIDYGDDLFGSASDEKKFYQKKVRLLLDSNKIEKLRDFVREIEKDGKATLIKELEGEIKKSLGINHNEAFCNFDIDSIEKDLLREISRYSKEKRVRKENFFKRLKILVGEERVVDLYNDFFYFFYSSDLHTDALKLVEYVLESGKYTDYKNHLNLIYLKAKALYDLGEYMLAISSIDEMIKQMNLAFEDLTSLFYFKAECFLKLGKVREAYFLFYSIEVGVGGYKHSGKKVERIDKN